MSHPNLADLLRRITIQDPNRKLDAEATLGERLADRVAGFGGSRPCKRPSS